MATVVGKQVKELPASGGFGPSSIGLILLWGRGRCYLGLLADPCYNFPPPLHLLLPPPLHILFTSLPHLLLFPYSLFLFFPPLLEQKTGKVKLIAATNKNLSLQRVQIWFQIQSAFPPEVTPSQSSSKRCGVLNIVCLVVFPKAYYWVLYSVRGWQIYFWSYTDDTKLYIQTQ